MALTENTQNLLDRLDDSRTNYETNYKVWQNKEEFKTVARVRSRLEEMYQARTNSCYLTNFEKEGSWDKHWDLVERNYLMYSKIDDEDDTPDVKSSMAYRTIQQIDARERKQEIDFLIEERSEEDKERAKSVTFRYLFQDYFRRNSDIRYKFFECSKRAKIFGTSIAYIPYTVKMREVSEPQVPKYKKEDYEKGELPEVTYDKKWKVDFEDVDFVPWDLRDFYVDPNAQSLHGSSYAASDCAGVLYLSIAQVRDMFAGDPAVRNLDKIKTTNEESYSSPFFKPPRDEQTGFCEVIIYYNKDTDSEIIICNDVLLKEGPIPYQDKQLPFVAFHLIKHPGQFYGMGIVDAVLQLSAEDSSMKNARLRAMRLSIEAPVFLGSTIFGEVDEQLDTIEPGQLIKVSDPGAVNVMPTPQIPFDSWRATEELKDEAVMTTGVNPQGLTLPMASTPATNTIAMKETMADIVNMYADSLMQGMNHWGALLYSRFCQFYKQPTKQAALELGKKEKRKLRLSDVALYEEDGQTIVKDLKGSQIIDLDESIFEWSAVPRIYISPDFTAPISRAHQMRKAQEILPQLAPFAGEPGAEGQDGQKPVIDIRKLVSWFLDQMGIFETGFMIEDDEDKIKQIEKAQKQHEKMMDGEDVESKPGEPIAHRYAHAIELSRINSTVENESFLALLQNPTPEVQEFVAALMDYKRKLTDHAEGDEIPKRAANMDAVEHSRAIEKALSGEPPQQQPQPGMPMNNQPGIPEMPGQMGVGPMVPTPGRMGQEDISGQQMGTLY